MTGLGTNALVRDLAQDDARQSALASRLIESFTPQMPGFVSIVTLAETVWVLHDGYTRNRDEVAAIIEGPLQTDGLIVRMSDVVWQALRGYASSQADFADHLVERLGTDPGCSSTATIDKAAARSARVKLVSKASQ